MLPALMRMRSMSSMTAAANEEYARVSRARRAFSMLPAGAADGDPGSRQLVVADVLNAAADAVIASLSADKVKGGAALAAAGVLAHDVDEARRYLRCQVCACVSVFMCVCVVYRVYAVCD